MKPSTLFSTDQPIVLLQQLPGDKILVRTFESYAHLVYALAPAERPRSCQLCGCTEEHACDGGCAWADDEQTICTRCVLASLQLALEPDPGSTAGPAVGDGGSPSRTSRKAGHA